jgi:SAM-dependent methyltransferase
VPLAPPERRRVTGAMDPFPDIVGYYERLIARHGHDPRACDYGSSDSQLAKFRVLADVADLRGRHVLDVGCGFADWEAFLQREVGGVRYSGIDVTPAMVEAATRLRPGVDLRVANLLDDSVTGMFDVVAANGIFYLLGGAAARMMESMVEKMFRMSRVATVFTTLSRWATDREPGEFYADPLETLRFCRRLTPWVRLRHDYHERDFAIYLYRERQR